MDASSISLLQDLRQPTAAQAWERFVRLYTPQLMQWARRLGLQDQDAADLVQDVLMVLIRKMPEFAYQPGGSFRGWLRTVLLNKCRDRPHRKPAAQLDVADAPAAPVDEHNLEEREHRLYVLGRALQLMSNDFEPATWQACWDTVVLGRPAADVAADLRITVNAVYLAKSRVLARPRRDVAGLLD